MPKVYSAEGPESKLEVREVEFSELKPEEVEIDVIACGLCHSDLSMLKNHWQMTQYPFTPGHEVVGTICKTGDHVKGLNVGDTVGLGWYSSSCMHCNNCLSGDHNLCSNELEQTIIGRTGGFADKVRCSWEWAVPLPEKLDPKKAGPLFCGGITVFNPIVQFDVQPTDSVGVVGIGGLGHLALQFLNKWGCEVTAFTSSESKAEEAKKFGAHNIINSRSADELEKAAGSFDFIISTVNATLDWSAYINALNAKGRLHFVGAVPEPIQAEVFSLIMKQRELSASPLGSPANTRRMLEFCARHDIAPQTEMFPMSEINQALEHLENGNARYRIVLEAN